MKSSSALILACALALAACDRKPAAPPAKDAAPPAPATPFERAEPIRWDDALNGFVYNGAPLPAARLWRFEDGPQGFSGQGATLSFSPIDGVHLTNDVYDALMRSPDGLALDGGRFNLVLVRLSRAANGPPWDGSLFWTTDAHGEVDAFHAKPFLGADPAVNETVVLAYDMTRPVKGGDDWIKSVVRRIRIDTDDGAGGKFIVREVAIVQNPAPQQLHAPPKPPVKGMSPTPPAGLR